MSEGSHPSQSKPEHGSDILSHRGPSTELAREIIDLLIPKFMIEDSGAAIPSDVQLSIEDLNDNIDAFLKGELVEPEKETQCDIIPHHTEETDSSQIAIPTNDYILPSRFYEYLNDIRRIVKDTNGKLIISSSPHEYFFDNNLAPKLRYPDSGISQCVVRLCELISLILIDIEGEEGQTDDLKKHADKTVVMVLEYYLLVGPMVFKEAVESFPEDQGTRHCNDCIFLKHFIKKLRSSSKSFEMKRELGNILAAMTME